MDGASAMLAPFEGGSSVGIYRRVLSFVRPLGDAIPLDFDDSAGAPSREDTTAAAVKKKMKLPSAAASKKRTEKDEVKAPADLQLLAERFLPFLSGALKLLPSSPRKCPREEERAGELFEVFRLVLNCLACVASRLPGKSSSVHRGRCDVLYHLVTWGKYEEAEEEGLSLLESLRSTLAALRSGQRGEQQKLAAYCRIRQQKARTTWPSWSLTLY